MIDNISNVIAIISLIVAIISCLIAFCAYRHSVRSSEISYQLHTESALSQSLQHHVDLLNTVSIEFDKIAADISTIALKTCTQLGEMLEKYDSKNGQPPYIRHSFRKALRITLSTFSHSFGHQNGLYLIDGLRMIKLIKPDVYEYIKQPAPTIWEKIYSVFRRNETPSTAELALYTSKPFFENLKELYSRIPSNKEPEIFTETLTILSDYRRAHQNNKSKLDDLEKQLEHGIHKNSLEIFSIQRSPNLRRKFIQIKGDINRFKELYFPDFYGIEKIPVYEGLAFTLYAGAVTYIASQRSTWGN